MSSYATGIKLTELKLNWQHSVLHTIITVIRINSFLQVTVYFKNYVYLWYFLWRKVAIKRQMKNNNVELHFIGSTDDNFLGAFYSARFCILSCTPCRKFRVKIQKALKIRKSLDLGNWKSWKFIFFDWLRNAQNFSGADINYALNESSTFLFFNLQSNNKIVFQDCEQCFCKWKRKHQKNTKSLLPIIVSLTNGK